MQTPAATRQATAPAEVAPGSLVPALSAIVVPKIGDRIHSAINRYVRPIALPQAVATAAGLAGGTRRSRAPGSRRKQDEANPGGSCPAVSAPPRRSRFPRRTSCPAPASHRPGQTYSRWRREITHPTRTAVAIWPLHRCSSRSPSCHSATAVSRTRAKSPRCWCRFSHTGDEN